MKSAYGYVRASTTDEVKQGSNETQKKIINDWAERNGYTIIKIYEDMAKSGKNTERPKFQEMIYNLADTPVDAVVVSKLDRLARSLVDLLNIVKMLSDKGIGFISVQDNGIDTTTPNGKLLLQILGAFAEFERNIINQRTSIGRERAKIMGVKFGRPRGKTEKGRYIDERKVLELYEKKLSARAIAKSMECSITPILRILKENGKHLHKKKSY